MVRIDPLRRLLPASLLEQAERLDSLGFDSFAWTIDSAGEVVDRVAKAGGVILGGDFWLFLDGNLKPAIEDWYYQPTGDDEIDIATAAAAAHEAIERARYWYGSDGYVVLVCQS